MTIFIIKKFLRKTVMSGERLKEKTENQKYEFEAYYETTINMYFTLKGKKSPLKYI